MASITLSAWIVATEEDYDAVNGEAIETWQSRRRYVYGMVRWIGGGRLTQATKLAPKGQLFASTGTANAGSAGWAPIKLLMLEWPLHTKSCLFFLLWWRKQFNKRRMKCCDFTAHTSVSSILLPALDIASRSPTRLSRFCFGHQSPSVKFAQSLSHWLCLLLLHYCSVGSPESVSINCITLASRFVGSFEFSR